MDPLAAYARALHAAAVRYVVIGVWGANYYARGSLFMTEDQDLFLPPDASNLLSAWQAAESLGLALSSQDEPLDQPRDLALARAVVDRRALVTVSDGDQLDVDLTLIMAGFDFETVWPRRRLFQVEGVQVPVAALSDIVASKAQVGRPKDRLFLATHAAALRKLLRRRS
jgi:hypothetical protein